MTVRGGMWPISRSTVGIPGRNNTCDDVWYVCVGYLDHTNVLRLLFNSLSTLNLLII